MEHPTPRALKGYAVAVGAVAGAAGLSWILWPLLQPTATPLFFVAIVLASWLGGKGPGLVATVLSAFTTEMFFYPPLFDLSPDLGMVFRLGVFLLAALLVNALNVQQRAARAHLEELAQTREALLRFEKTNRAEAEIARRRATLLAEASAMLAATADPEEALRRLARLVVPELGHCAAVDLVVDGDRLRRLTLAHADPAEEQRLAALPFPFPPDARWLHGAGPILRRGEPEVHPAIDDEKFDAVAPDAARLQELRALGLGSWLCLPLRAGETIIGALSLAFTGRQRRHGPDDVALAEDLTRRVALALDNQRLYREAQETNRIKEEFLGTLSHELRTPINAILGWSRLLSGGVVDEAGTQGALGKIERNGTALAKLIDDLLDFTQVIAGRPSLEHRPLDLAVVIEAALTAAHGAAEAKGLTLVAVFETRPVPVLGDEARLRQAVGNLLANAVTFTPAGGRVEARVGRSATHAWVRISDTGVGISASFLPHLFERFRQAESSKSRRHGGVGLGLAMTRRLVELHQGTVRAESAGEGRGSTFTIELPLRDTAMKTAMS